MAKSKHGKSKVKSKSSVADDASQTKTGEREADDDILRQVVNLGGSKKDLALIAVEDASDVEDLEIVDEDTEPVKRDDILQLIEELGIRKERPDFSKKEKKVKLAVSEYADEQPSSSKEGKKSKNKFKLQDSEVSSTTPPEAAEDQEVDDADLTPLLKYIQTGYRKRSQPIIKPGRWLAQLESKEHPVHTGRPHKDLAAVEKFASQVLDDDTDIANSSQSGADKSNRDWVKKMVSKGTLADRAAALTTLIQEDVVHNIASLEGMVGMVSKKDRRESMAAIGSLKDIFIDLLPNKRRLRSFQQMPLESVQHVAGGNKDTQDRLLALWYFESRLKKVYENFVNAVLAATFDTVVAHKLSSLKVALDLLTHKPEQEQKLLAGLVNKLGDPERKVAANTAHLLVLLVRKHPNMKLVVATEVENLLYRPNIAQKAQYYAVCFLNQMLLSQKDKDLSVKLVTIYFSFFKASIKKNEVDSKMMSALLVGVVRAFPFAKDSDKLDIEGQMSAIYKLVHTVNKLHVSLQALALLFQVCTASDSMTDRYYTSLYAKLLDSELKNSSKQSMFLNLVYKSMKSDPSDRRCKAFVKRLLQICAYQSPTFTCAALITVSELVKSRPGVLSLKTTHLEGDDSEEEHFVDADSEADSDAEQQHEAPKVKSHGWTHKSPHAADVYDGMARNPLSCCADKAIETELLLLSRHYHPSVVVFAKQLLDSEAIIYTGDPMTDFSLQKFLDRFVFRNPKKLSKQGKAEHFLSSHKNAGKGRGADVGVLPVNTEDFYKLDTDKVPADQKFFHSYFHKLTDNSQHKLGSSLGKAAKEESDDSDVDDDDFDSYLAKYERSLYKDMSEDAFGDDFASDFKKRKSKDKSKEGEESDSDSGLSDDDLDDNEAGLDLKLEDFGLNEDDIGGAGGGSSITGDSQAKQLDSDDDVSSEASEDLPLSLDGSEGGDIEGLFAPAEDFEEGVAFSDDEFSSLDFSGKSKGKAVSKKYKSIKKDSKAPADQSQSLFAAADEFADLLDEESADKRDTITSSAVVNRGKADAKQVAWEDKQERWLTGRNRKRPHKSPGKKSSQRGAKSKRKM